MPTGWLSRNDIQPSEYLHADQLNSLANDIRNWGGDVNGGGHRLSNVVLSGSGGFDYYASPMQVTPGIDGQSVSGYSVPGALSTDPPLERWTVGKDATAETGGNSGSNFAISRYSDAGAVIDSPITINRATGLITMGQQKWVGAVDGNGQTFTNVVLGPSVTLPPTVVVTTGSYANPAWITSFAWGKLTGTPATFPPSAHTHPASDIVSGILPPARLGSGTPDNTMFLRGDGVWAVPAGGGSGGGGSQTPWASDINANGFMLYSASKIGIGTASPTQPFVVHVAADRNLAVYNDNTFGAVCLNSANDANNALKPLAFNASSYLFMNGNVGIGTASPTSKLHITGDSFQGGLWLDGGDGATAIPIAIHSDKDFQWSAHSIYSDAGHSDALAIQTRYSDVAHNLLLQPSAGKIGIATTTPGSVLSVRTATGNSGDAAYFGVSGDFANGVVIARAATANPIELWLGVNQAGPYTEIQGARAGVGTNSPLVLNRQGGGVGIGTVPGSNPGDANRLEVNGAAMLRSAWPRLYFQISGHSAVPSISMDGSDNLILDVPSGGGQMIFSVNGNGCLNMATTSYIGIGTASPQYKLHVMGDVNCTGVYRVNGTPISGGGGVSNQNSYTSPARVFNTVYQNTTGKALFVNVIVACANSAGATAVSDTSSSPTTVVSSIANPSSTSTNLMIGFWVLAGSYYKVGGAGTQNGWIEWY